MNKFRIFAGRSERGGWMIATPNGLHFWRPTWAGAVDFLNQIVSDPIHLAIVLDDRAIRPRELTHR